MGQVLYRKYRSRSLDEIVGQEHITTTLKNALKSGAISHAYLFTGPRGTGKTSIARILAHELNNFEYSDEDSHLDIIEIDAASNRGIDEIRDLREKVSTAPSGGTYKVYIIDEVHMLTTPAFNALLKTLEEPPAHVIFILATTEAHKLPETITSRTQRYTFRPVDLKKVGAHLKHIAAQEKISVTDEALALIAAHGEGSFRDSISLLDQAASHGKQVTAETVRDVLGMPSEEALSNVLRAISIGDISAVTQQLSELHARGYQAAAVAKQLAARCRLALLDKSDTGLTAEANLELMARLIDVPASPAPERLLEIILLQATIATSPKVAKADVTSTPIQRSETSSPVTRATQKRTGNTQTTKTSDQSGPNHAQDRTQPQKTSSHKRTGTFNGVITDIWPQVLDAMKKQHNTVYGILRMAQPQITDGRLTLEFQYAFHQKRIQDVKQRQIISGVIEDITGSVLEIECVHNKDAEPMTAKATETGEAVMAKTPAASPGESTQAGSLATVSNIFGGGELLES